MLSLLLILSGSNISQFSSFTSSLELILYDLKSKIRQHLSANSPDNFVVIDIDEASLEKLGNWPWSRSLLSEGMTRIHAYGAEVIALDLLFPQSRGKVDRGLADVIEKTSTVPAVVFDFNHQTNTGDLPESVLKPPVQEVSTVLGWVGQMPVLANKNLLSGHINPFIDQDGIIRRIPVWIHPSQNSLDHAIYPPISLAMLVKAYPEDVRTQVLQSDNFSWLLNRKEVWIPYDFSADKITTIPFYRLYDSSVSETLKGKFVLIGSSAVGLSDLVNTPVQAQMPGVFLHVFLAHSFLNQQIIYEIQPIWPLFGLLLLSAALMFLLRFAKIEWSILLLATYGTGFTVFAFYSFNAYGWHLLMTPSLTFISLLLIAMIYDKWQQTKIYSRQVESLFSAYVSGPDLKELTKQASDSLQQVQKKELTVMFVDLVDYTKLAENLPPDELMKLTRKLLSIMTQAVLDHRGTVDKYMGDAIMAFWNAPLDVPNHEKVAVEAAQQILEHLQQWKKLNPQWQEIEMGIGIHTGEALVGNIGTEFRHAYSTMGDTVNIAARIEKLTREYKVPIIMGAQTAQNCQKPTQHLGQIRIKGKKECVDIYTLC